MPLLVRDHSLGAYSVHVACLTCGSMLLLADAVIDREGPPFRAYYHDTPECRPAGPVENCGRNGCHRGH